MNSDRVCVDASVAVAWLTLEEYTQNANALRLEWRENQVDMVCPGLFHVEVASAIRKQVYLKNLLPDEGEEAFALSLEIPLSVIDGAEVQRKAWELAKHFNLPVCYDMQYLAVAEMEDCELWTADRRLVNVTRGKSRRVRWLGEYQKRS